VRLNNEARADESVMIPFGPYSPECVEQVFSEFGHEFIGNSSTHASLVPRRRDKGKPAAKRGRKAYGPPKARWGGGGCQVIERRWWRGNKALRHSHSEH
jgi:hypothetical protein